MSEEAFEIKSSEKWSDDSWFKNQDKRSLEGNRGYLVINEGQVEGMIIGGNVNTLNLLQGAEFFPDIAGSILFVEDDAGTDPYIFDRDLQSLIHLPGFDGVKGLVIGRFQKASKISDDLLIKIVKTKKELENLPVIANIDFGHTDPKITFPVGGEVKITAKKRETSIKITRH